MKKALSLILALVMLMSFSAVAFADGATTKLEDTASVDIYKQLNIGGNNGATAPAETYNFTVALDGTNSNYPEGYTPPAIASSFTISFEATNKTANKSATVDLPDYTRVGTYVYTLKETVGNTLGVTYDKTPVYMVVTVLTDGNTFYRYVALHRGSVNGAKIGGTPDAAGYVPAFTNTFDATTPTPPQTTEDPTDTNVTGLSLKKTVSGNSGDRVQYFPFEVTFTVPTGKTYNGAINISSVSNASNPTTATFTNGTGSTTFTVYLKANETVTFSNVPVDMQYSIQETNTYSHTATSAGFTTAFTGNTLSNSVVTRENHKEVINNHREQIIENGVSLDSLPYVIMLVTVAAAAMLIVLKKKANRA